MKNSNKKPTMTTPAGVLRSKKDGNKRKFKYGGKCKSKQNNI